MQDPWWLRSTVYQIYPRSFCDSNGDGIGDLPGITSRLDHLQALGVDVVWLSPVYRSPNDDNGYDISDYREIMAEFGSMADFETMIAAMHERGIRLVMDLVVNHTSDEHPWFERARRDRNDPFHDFYIWREPRGAGEPGSPAHLPNNWEAAFGGSAWEWNAATGEYCLHMFSRKQPDLNWEHPPLRAEIHDLMRFWLAKGVAGFRMDVINMISKRCAEDGRLPDAPVARPGFLQPGFPMVVNGPRLLEHLLEMKHAVLRHHDALTVGEAPLATPQVGRALTHRDRGALDMLFQFEHMDLDIAPGHALGKWARRPLDLRELKASMARWQHEVGEVGWNSLYLGNHDQPRQVSRFGDDGRWRVASAKLLATWLHLHQGTPFVYQGEELGMTNAGFGSLADYRDLESLNFARERLAAGDDEAGVLAALRWRSRDNARTPMQWDDGPNAGFTTGTPWIAVNPNHAQINARQARADPDSVFHHYRQLIALRRTHPVVVHGRYAQCLPDHPQVDLFTRTLGTQVLLVACNFGGSVQQVGWPAGLPAGGPHPLLGSPPADLSRPLVLQPWQAGVWLFGGDAG